MYRHLWMLELELANGVAPIFRGDFICNVIDEGLHVLGEAEHTCWTQGLSTSPLCYLDEEAVDVFSGNAQEIVNAHAYEVRCKRPEALTER